MYQLISYLYYNHSISFLSCCWILVEANFSWVLLSWSRIRVRVRESGSSDRFYFLRLQNRRVLKSRDITLPTKVRVVKAMAFPVVMYRCESWIIKKAEPKLLNCGAGEDQRRQWQPTPVLLPGKSHGQRSLVGCSPWGCEESGHDWATSLSLFTFMHWRRKWQPTPVFLPGEPQGQQSLVGCHLWGCTELDTTEAT